MDAFIALYITPDHRDMAGRYIGYLADLDFIQEGIDPVFTGFEHVELGAFLAAILQEVISLEHIHFTAFLPWAGNE